jgi:hypothetical protein
MWSIVLELKALWGHKPCAPVKLLFPHLKSLIQD